MNQPTLERINKEKKEGTVLRQIKFPSLIYKDASEIMEAENNRLGLVTRREKIHSDKMLYLLVADGIKFRRGEVYTPEDLLKTFAKDSRWVKLKAKAEAAIEELFELQKAYMQ